MKNYVQKKFGDRLNLIGIAKNGAEAKELYNSEQNNIDVVFLDVKMPDMTGFDVLDEIERRDDIQIVMVTGQQERAIDAFDYGITDYLVKPFSSERFEKTLSRVERNHSRTTDDTIPENRIIKKIAEYMFSRDLNALEPIPTRYGKMGYVYPMLTANFEFEREHEILKLMNAAEKSGFFTSSFADSLHVCNSCFSSYLHYRECCPKCGSSDINNEDLIHHFQCANVSAQGDYYEAGDTTDMVCPKCNRILKHIGVDYDKPGVIYNCQNCDHTFQNPQINSLCLNCGTENKVEHLVKRKFKNYFLTSLGRDAAQGKVAVKLSGYEDLNGIIDEPYFLRILKRESERKKEAEFQSCIGAVKFMNFSDLQSAIGKGEIERLVSELQEIISGIIKPADEIIFRNLDTALILFSEKGRQQSEVILDEICESLREFIRDNFNDFELELASASNLVEENTSTRNQVDNLLEKLEKQP